MFNKLKSAWKVLTSKNYVVITADEHLQMDVKFRGKANSLYMLLFSSLKMYEHLLKDQDRIFYE